MSVADRETFWSIRAARYDRLYWTRDEPYLDCIRQAAQLKRSDVVLDVGTGTGIMARAMQPHVKHVVALDNSDAMLQKGKWEGFSVVKSDISDLLFTNNVFDKVLARMVFHHILDNLNRAILRCYDLLKYDGMLIVAEGVPPSDDKEVVDWYTHMFSFKEERRTFTSAELPSYLERNGFGDVRSYPYTMKSFSVRNWLDNSGLSMKNRQKIMDLHLEASPTVKRLYNMRIAKDDCLIDTHNVIVVGRKAATS